MRNYLFCALLIIVLVSCSKYQYATLNGNVPRSKSGLMIAENDTLAVYYSFSGHRGPVRVEVFNKLEHPIEISMTSWSMTRLTWPNSNAKPFLTASSQSNMIQPDLPADYLQTEHPVYDVVLAAHSSAALPELILRESFFKLSTPEMFNKHMNGDLIRVQVFGKDHTPLRFVHQIRYVLAGAKTGGVFDHEFWVDEVFVTMMRPEHVHEYKARGNMFYIKKPSGAGVFLASVGCLTYLAASHITD